jgi:hypothetical protein
LNRQNNIIHGIVFNFLSQNSLLQIIFDETLLIFLTYSFNFYLGSKAEGDERGMEGEKSKPGACKGSRVQLHCCRCVLVIPQHSPKAQNCCFEQQVKKGRGKKERRPAAADHQLQLQLSGIQHREYKE